MTNTILSRLSVEGLAEYYSSGFWRDETLYSLLSTHARLQPDRFSARDRSRRLTFAKLLSAVDVFADDLAAKGLRAGQRLAIWLPSRVETVIALLACSRNGYIFCPSFHRDHTGANVIELLRRFRVSVLIHEAGYGADVNREPFAPSTEAADLKHLYQLEPVAKLDGSSDLFFGLSASSSTTSANGASRSPDRVSYLAFTSGTTGEPKAAMHTDNTLLANARAIAADWDLGPHSIIYSMSPLSHNLGIGSLVIAMLTGAEFVVHDIPRTASVLARLIEIGATYLVGVPTHAIDLLAEVRAAGGARLADVKGFRISGAAAPANVVSELMSYGAKPQSGYGMTETCSHHYTLPSDEPKRIVETSGRACPGFETRIWTEINGDIEAGPGEVGQIGCRGASLMMGYFDDQAATERSFNASGWFLTGDLGSLDSEGYLKITGRAKDLIIRGGHNIHPARVEALATKHSAIEGAAAFPVSDARLGEKVGLAVVFRAGRTAQPEEVLAHLEQAGLSRYDMPEYFLSLDRFPLTASGKILKREIVARVADGRLKPTPVRWSPRAVA